MGFLSVSGKLSPVTWTSRLLCALASKEVMDATSERRGQKHMDIIRHSTGSRGHWIPQHASQLCSSDRVSSLTLPGTQLRHWTCPCSAHVSGEQPGNEMTPPTWRNTKDHLKGRERPKAIWLSRAQKTSSHALTPACSHNPPWLAGCLWKDIYVLLQLVRVTSCLQHLQEL